MKHSIFRLFLLPVLLLLLQSCGPPPVDPDKPGLNAADFRYPRPNYPVSGFNRKLYLHMRNDYTNKTLYSYFELWDSQRRTGTLIMTGNKYTKQDGRHSVCWDKSDRIWEYVEKKGTTYWEEKDGKWIPKAYQEPWEGVAPAPLYFKTFMSEQHPH